MGGWAPLVPYAKAHAALSDGMLGLLLLCVGAGSVVAMPLAGAACGRLGCRTVILGMGALACATLPLLATLSGVPVLAAAMFAFGAGIGSVDCAMNVQAIAVERASGRPLMSGFHGLYSAGGIVGAAGVAAMLAAGTGPGRAALVVAALLLLLLATAAPGLLGVAARQPGPLLAMPRGAVLLLGALCFVAFLAEGAALDWSAILLTLHGVPPAYAGLGFAAFSTTMTAGRLTGDALVRRLGGRPVLRAGAATAAAGLALAALSPWWPASLLGYALLGAGGANIVPVLFTAIGRQTDMPEHAAVPAITTMGYAGILLGPAAIGALAGTTSLATALLAVAALLAGVSAVGSRLPPAPRPPDHGGTGGR